ncbi:MAG: HAMP domain-containing methyl-accepting chemotaxis protein [Limnobacter sp.]|nr:HAMP domain-containing methyl-accepting chemotaxis protein [Limnobacter sp.]
MKNWSVKSMLLSNSLASNTLIILLGLLSLLAMYELDQVVTDSNQNAVAVQRQMDADMMHDAIRSDVMSALYAASQDQADQIPNIRMDLTEHADRLLSNLTENAQVTNVEGMAEHSRAVLAVAKQYVQKSKQLIQLSTTQPNVSDALAGMMVDFELLEVEMEKLSGIIANHAQVTQARSNQILQLSQWLIGSILVIALIITIPLSTVTIKSINAPLQNLVNTMQKMEREGDLTQRAAMLSNNEIGRASKSFNTLMNSVQEIVQDVRLSSQQLLTNSHALAQASQQSLAASASNSEAAGSVAAAVEELSASIANIAQQANIASEASANSYTLTQKGRTDIDLAGKEMSQISESVKTSAHSITLLEEQAASISQITGVIRGIAEQTNLLALNAAIEAARAGEGGRGFAVVADEVRNLAERTADSTKKITHMIEAIQIGTQDAVKNMNEGVERVSVGVSLTHDVVETMGNVASKANKASQAVSQISESLREQESAGGDISRTVERVAQITEESHAVARETAVRAQELSELAVRLEERISRFKA